MTEEQKALALYRLILFALTEDDAVLFCPTHGGVTCAIFNGSGERKRLAATAPEVQAEEVDPQLALSEAITSYLFNVRSKEQ